jgi:sugar phosphate isomerase/epimerase
MTRRHFLAQTGVAGASLAEPAGEIQPALYSVTYLGLWYRGEALTMEQFLNRAQRYGYKAVEIEGKRPHGCPLDWSRQRCQEFRKRAAGSGLAIAAVGAMNDFSSPIPEQREAQLIYVRDLVRMSGEMGAKVVRLFLGWTGATPMQDGGGTYEIARRIWDFSHKGFTQEQIWNWCRQGLIEASHWAGDHGVVLALQNHKPVIATYKDVLRMVREVGSPHLKVCLDAPIMEDKSADYLREAVEATGALQVHSHFGGEYEKAADGSVHLRDSKEGNFYVPFLQALLENGYRGYISYELCHPLPMVNGRTVGIEFADENARLAIEFMRASIEEARRRAAAA